MNQKIRDAALRIFERRLAALPGTSLEKMKDRIDEEAVIAAYAAESLEITLNLNEIEAKNDDDTSQ